jgi:hypothetical protein
MLYRLEVDNFYSIRDHQVLDLTIAPNVPDPDNRYAQIFPGSTQRAPKVVAIFGKNASGKTNLLKALEFLFSFVRAPQPQHGWPTQIERFNDADAMSRPMTFAVELGGVMNLSADVMARIDRGEEVLWGTYRYELQLEVVNGLIVRIQSEALRQRPGGTGKWQRVFERDEDGQIKDSSTFSLKGYHHLLNTLAPNVSVLSSFAHFQHAAAQQFVAFASRALFQSTSTLQFANDNNILNHLKQRPGDILQLNKELTRIDVGVEGVRIVETPQGPQLVFKHSGLQVEMPWVLESHGTQKFIKIFPIIAGGLSSGGVVVIDELDNAIHPAVLPELTRWFYDADRNPSDAQLWITCHAASLLDELNKEEIVICDKDRLGRTSFVPLMDVKVRRDDNLYRKYLSGALGGVPHIG